MSQATINIRMDEDLKKSMESICQELGINMTTAFTIFAKKMTREKRIPFEVSIDPFFPNETTLAAFDEGEKMLRDPNSLRFKNVDDLFKELDS